MTSSAGYFGSSDALGWRRLAGGVLLVLLVPAFLWFGREAGHFGWGFLPLLVAGLAFAVLGVLFVADCLHLLRAGNRGPALWFDLSVLAFVAAVIGWLSLS